MRQLHPSGHGGAVKGLEGSLARKDAEGGEFLRAAATGPPRHLPTRGSEGGTLVQRGS